MDKFEGSNLKVSLRGGNCEMWGGPDISLPALETSSGASDDVNSRIQ